MELLRFRWIILSVFCVYLLRPTFSAVSFIPKTAVLFPNDSVTFTCNETSFRFWIINETSNILQNSDLQNIDGVSSDNGTMLIVTQSINNTLYGCAIALGDGTFITDTGILYVATAPDQVPGVMVIADSISLDDDIVTLTLSWGKPFSNFDPIVSYTVSCSGDDTCPPNFSTPDNTTTTFDITNLTSMTDYIFSAVATNSIGSGEAGVVMITTPSLPDSITGVMLMCEVINQINQCTVQWDSITVGSELEQPLIYEVYYNRTMHNVTSSTTMLTFTVPSLPEGVFSGNITVTVTAINRFGHGMPSDPEDFLIMSSSVIDAQTVVTPEDTTNRTYLFTVTCIIHADSIANECIVTATPDDQSIMSRTGTGPVSSSMATVTIDGLNCGVTYAITAGGRLGGELFGLISTFGTAMGNCSSETTPNASIPTNATTPVTSPPIIESPGTSTDDNNNTGAIVGGVVGGICGVILLMLLILLLWWCCIKISRPRNTPMAKNNIPVYDAVQDPEVSDTVKMEPNPAYQGIPSDQVKIETNPAYQVITSDHEHTNEGPDPAYEVLASNLANKGPNSAYQDLSSYSGSTSASKQKPGDVNYYENIINDQNITMTMNPSYAVP